MLQDNERIVYAAVRDFAKRGERPTIAAVARMTGVPRSSVALVADTLGYHGWIDFTTQLVRYFSSFQREDALSDSVQLVASVLSVNRDRPVLIDAIGDAEVFIQIGLLRMCEVGFHAMPYGPGVVEALSPYPEKMSKRFLDKDDAAAAPSMRVLKGGTGIVGPDIATQPAAAGVLIVVNESGMSLLPTCLKAASGGFDIIAITASHDTPVSKLAKVNVVIKNNKSTPEAYEPNYFAAGVLAFMERVFSRVSQRPLCSENCSI